MPDHKSTPDAAPETAHGGEPLAAFREDPGNANLFTELHKSLKKQGDHAGLAELLELRAEKEGDRLRAAKHLAEAAERRLALGDSSAAETDFRRALALDPAQNRASAHFADYLIERRRFAEAAAVIEAEVAELATRAESGRGKGGDEPFAARRSSRHAMLAGIWDQNLGRVDRALHHWQRAWQLDPKHTEALEAARVIYGSLGDDAMVVRLYEAELDVLGKKANAGHRAQLYLAIGRLQIKRRQMAEAAAALEESLRLDSTSPTTRETLADLYASPAFADDPARQQRAAGLFVDLGQEWLRRGELDDAIRYLRRALGVDPFSRSAAADLERALRQSERWDELDRLYRHLAGVLREVRERIELARRRCALYREQLGDRDGYKETLAELAELEGPGSKAAAELRQIYREDENWTDLAERIVKDAESLDPNSPEFAREMLELSTIEREFLRNRERAAEHIHRVLQYNPRQEEALARYADHFRERRDWRGLADLGEFALEKIVESGARPDEMVRRLEELALLYEQRLGDMERAVGAWQRIATIEPNNPKAPEAMRRLSSRTKTWQSLIGVLEQEAETARTPAERAEVLKRIAQTYRERHFNPRRAIALYEEVLSLFPDDAASLKSVAELYDREGDEAGLAHTIRRQLELDERLLDREQGAATGRPPTAREWPVTKRVERLNLLRRLASMYEDRVADVDGVVFACSGILEILPGDRDALSRMERVLERAGDVVRLEQTLQYHAASASGPAERAKVLRRLARLATERDDEVASMERWEQVLGVAPNDREALEALSGLYERHKRWGELASVLERRVLAPSSPEPGTPAAAARAVELRRYAQVVDAELGDAGRAIKAWRKLLDLFPKDRQALEALARLYEASGQWRELVAVLERHVPLYLDGELPKAAEVTLKRATLLEERLGAPADAAAALEGLLADIDPANLAGHKALRRLYEGRGDFESAVRIAEREIYLATDPSQKIARGLEIGFLCRDRLGDAPRALQAFERVLEIDADHREALEAAGELYAVVGNWTRHVELLEQQLERVKAGRERRALMLRIGQTVAERLGNHKDAFVWYRRAHAHAPDPSTLAELRRAAEAYGLWRELIEIYEEEREALKGEDGSIKSKGSYVELCREISAVAERRLRDAARAIEALRDALVVQPRSETLLAEAERIARDCDQREIWQAYLECVELPMAGMDRPTKVATLIRRSRIIEDNLADAEGAMKEILRAFAWQPEREETWQAIYELGERSGKWEEVASVLAAQFERAPTRELRLQRLRQKAELIEQKIGDRVRAFRMHLSAFLLAPEDSETLADLWRLAREIGTYKEAEQVPAGEPAAAHVEAPEPIRSRPLRPSQPPPASNDRTMELSLADLVAARQGALLDDTVDEEFDDSELPTEEDGEQEIPPPGVGDRTQPLDLNDLMLAEERASKPHSHDPTMVLRTEDLIEALGARRQAANPPAPLARPRRQSKAPPLPQPAPRIARAKRATNPPPAPAPVATAVVPRMPVRRYESPWDELSSAYELLPTPSPAMKLRWLFRSAEVQETGAQDIERAFDILAKALEVAPEPGEARDRLYRLAEEHDAWERLAQLYQRAADEARSSEAAASYLLEVAEIRTRQNRPLETETLFRRILGMRPDDDHARSKLEALYRREGRWIDLAASLEERTDPRLGSAAPELERPALLRELADVYQSRLQRPHDAIEALSRLRELVPEDTAVLTTMADLHASMGRWSKVIDCLTKVADVADGTSEAREALHRIAGIYENNLELVDRALDAYDQIVAQWPDDGDAYAALDRLYEHNGRWEELSATLRRRAALTREPEERAELLGRRAKILLEWLDAPDEAAAALRHARTIRPDDEELADSLIEALTRAGREREAAAALEGRIANLRDRGVPNPGRLAALLIRLATLRHENVGDREGARRALDEALELVPDHPTALAAKAKLARDERDPRVYAEALLRQVEAQDDVDANVATLMEAGLVFRDRCRDSAAARTAFERVLELRPFHAEATWALAGLVEQGGDLDSAAGLLNKRLEDESLSEAERAEVLTQLAALARQAGVDAVAEHRLDEALAVVPTHSPAIIAKSDLLFELEQFERLEAFLGEVLPKLEDAEPAIRAALRRRLASVLDRVGRADEAYQVLLEADRLHRGDVLIKLALGENRYRARRWREAALHLGALAEHPDAERHPAEVAEGLYHAALAEIRSLRPDKAAALYERAIELKPNFGPALHALAELAMERGDSRRAADLLTRQASATSDAGERLRMFEALGDMAMLTLADEERARVCYEAAVNAADPLEALHVPLLKKLLELQDLAGDNLGSARTAELLASFADKGSERAARLTLAAESYMAAGDRRRAVDAAERAIAADPHDLMAASVASQLAMESGAYDNVISLLARTLGGKRTSDEVTGPREALLWDRLGQARLKRGDRKGAISAFERAVAVAPDSDGAMQARRGLLELWQGDEETKSRLIEYHRTIAVDSRELGDVIAYGRALSAVKQYDGGRAILELAKALGFELSEDDLVFMRRQPVRVMAADEAYNGSIDDDLHRRLMGEVDSALMSQVMATLWESASLLFSDTDSVLASRGLSGAERLSASSPLPVAAIFTRIANALRVPATLLYRSDAVEADFTVICSSPPIVVFGPRLCQLGEDAIPESELRFILGRAVELVRPENVIAAGLPKDELEAFVTALEGAFGGGKETEAAKKLKTTLPIRTRKPLAELVARATGADLDAQSYVRAVERKADRAGYLVCGDAVVSLRLTEERGSREGTRHLVEMALQEEFVEARRVLGVGVLR